MNYRYIFSGTLPENTPTYIERQADEELYEQLKAKQFCYVFNSRKMGKSSLRVRVMRRLINEGFACGVIDLSLDEVQLATPNQWYFGLLNHLTENFALDIDLDEWWDSQPQNAPLTTKLRKFIETILLQQIAQNIAIFIDEIDSVLSLNFPTDDFFAFIRGCYNLRVDNSAYDRLTICLLGVATPSTLIKDKKRTPFNIGHRIELTGFTLAEAQPLAIGLEGKVPQPKEILAEILKWTKGQPFLTQKLCHLVLRHGLSERLDVQELVQTQIIENWEYQDEPEHLRTIRDRLINSDEKLRSRILGLHQQLLEQETIDIDASVEQIELRLSGIATPDKNQLKITNPIYALIFDRDWLDGELAKLRPYAESFKAWVASNEQDESRLLRGQALQEALTWLADKSLSDRDNRYIAASLELDSREAKAALEAQKQANRILTKARKKAVWLGGVAIAALIASIVISVVTIAQANHKAQVKVAAAELDSTRKASDSAFRSGQEFEALLEALKATQQLKQLDKSVWTQDYRKTQLVISLLKAIYSVKEKNRIEFGNSISKLYLTERTIAVYDADAQTVQLLNPASGKAIATLRIPEPTDLIFSPDGQIIATISNANRAIQLWKRDGTLLRTIAEDSGAINRIEFSPDGLMIAAVISHSGTQDTVKLWKTDSTLIKTFSPQRFPVVSFSPDGKILVIENSNADKKRERTLQLWKLDNSTLLKTFINVNYSSQGLKYDPEKDFDRSINTDTDIEFSPDGQLIASAGVDGTLRIWDLQGKNRILAGHEDIIRDFSFSPDSQMIATASRDRTVKLWQPNGTLLKTLTGHSGGVNRVQFSLDGQTIATASSDRTVKLWQRDGIFINSLEGHSEAVMGAIFSSDGQNILSVGMDRTVKLWQWQGVPIPTLTGHTGEVDSLSFSSDSQTIATASKDGTVKLWQGDGRLLQTFILTKEDKFDRKTDVSLSPDGQTVATTNKNDDFESDNEGLKFWQRDGTLLKTLHLSNPSAIDYSPNGQIIAVAIFDKVQLWKQDGTLVATLNGHSSFINDIRFSPDNQTIATASNDGTIKLWQYDGNLLRTLVGHKDAVTSISFSWDGQTIASASRDRTVKLWHIDGTLLKTFVADEIAVKSISFSPDGQAIATVGYKKVKLWTKDGTLLMEYGKAGEEYNTVSFSPDGEILAVAAKDGTVKLLNLEIDFLSQLGCNWMADYLSTHPYQQKEIDVGICKHKRFDLQTRHFSAN